MNKYEEILGSLGLTLPEPMVPVATFSPYVISGGLVFISGQIPVIDGQVKFIGKLGRDFTVEQGQEAAQLCGLQMLAHANHICGGDLNRVARWVRLGGFINSIPDFAEHPQVMNGASDLLVAVLGDRGHHARAAVGVCSLPYGVAVEVDGCFEIS